MIEGRLFSPYHSSYESCSNAKGCPPSTETVTALSMLCEINALLTGYATARILPATRGVNVPLSFICGFPSEEATSYSS